MKDLLLNMMGITETKIGILDIIINLARKNNGMVSLEDLQAIREGVIEEAKKGELDDVFTKMEGKK